MAQSDPPPVHKPQIRELPLATLKPAPYNPRQIDDAALAGLTKSLERFGYVEPIIWNERTGYVVGGHQRLKVLESKNVETAPVVVVNLDDTDEKALNVALNSPHISGGFTDDLQTILAEIRVSDEALYHELRLDQLFDASALSLPGDPEAIPDIPKAPTTQPGDIYVLGRHRLYCGDCTDPAAWDAVAGGSHIAVFTSPPYGMGENAKLRDKCVPGAAQRKSLYATYDDAPAVWLALMRQWTDLALKYADVVFCNVQMLANNKRDIVTWVSDYASHLVDVATWDKATGAPQMQANVLNNAFEWVVILSPKPDASRAIPLAKFHGSESNVVRVPINSKKHNDGDHKAAMPLEFAEKVISLAGDARLVVDPFGGTGTTMVAAERLGLSAGLIELDPLYCDVIVQRWEAFTGGKAVLHRGER